jgi:hypothetical protein
MNLKQMNCNKCLSDFILIFLIFFFVAFPKEMNDLAQSILGKIITIILIIYYTWNHILYGLLFCVIVVLYYQLQFTNEAFTLAEQNYCVDGNLKYKEFEINPEMGEHIFPIQFTDNHCNPCNPTCNFSLINHKINVEKEILKPKNSNDMYNVIMKRFGLQQPI